MTLSRGTSKYCSDTIVTLLIGCLLYKMSILTSQQEVRGEIPLSAVPQVPLQNPLLAIKEELREHVTEMQKVSKEATWCRDPKAVAGVCNVGIVVGIAMCARPSFCLLNMCAEKNRSGMARQLYFSKEHEGIGHDSSPHEESFCSS